MILDGKLELVVLILLGLVAVALLFPIFRFILFQSVSRFFFKIFRFIYSYPSLIMFLVPAIIAGLALYFAEMEAIVTVTLFYATILFLGSILQTDRPYPIHSREVVYYDRDYGDSENPGFAYEFAIQNQGERDLLNPKVEYKLYNREYELVEGWLPAPGTRNQVLQINSGDESDKVTIEGESITDDSDPDFYLIVRVLPRRGNWILGDWWLKEIGVNPEE